jgi:hypothetical protein
MIAPLTEKEPAIKTNPIDCPHWFERVGSPGNGDQWKRHQLAEKTGETRTTAVVDFNRGVPTTGWTRHAVKQNWSNAVTVILAYLDNVACVKRGANKLRWWCNAGSVR